MLRMTLLTLCAVLGGCTSLPCELELKLNPDGSGSLQHVRATVRAEPLPESQVMKGVSAPEGYVATAYRAVFSNANELKIGDIEASFAEFEGGFRMKLVIPTTAASQWYRALGLDLPQVEAWERVSVREKALVGPAPDGSEKKEIRDLPFFTFKVRVPGDIRTSRLQSGLPEGWRLEERSGLLGPPPDPIGPRESRNSTYCETELQVPFRQLFSAKVKSVTWEVTCGPFEESNRSEWEETRRRLEAAKRPR